MMHSMFPFFCYSFELFRALNQHFWISECFLQACRSNQHNKVWSQLAYGADIESSRLTQCWTFLCSQTHQPGGSLNFLSLSATVSKLKPSLILKSSMTISLVVPYFPPLVLLSTFVEFR
jgi:hypothetical protein